MMKTTEQFLTERLKEIDEQAKFLREEKAKIKQALDAIQCEDITTKTANRNSYPKEPTFKEKVKLAMIDKFHSGATALELLDYLQQNWERPIVRTSLSPQLSRLKSEGVLILDGDVWKMAKKESTPNKGADSGNAGTLLSVTNEPYVQNR